MAIGLRFTIFETATIAQKPTIRIAGAIEQSIFRRYGPPIDSSRTGGYAGESHPIVSFQFGDNDHVAFSIEARLRPDSLIRHFSDSFANTA